MSLPPRAASRIASLAWFGSLACLGVMLINFIGALTRSAWAAPVALILDVAGMSGGDGWWSRCVLGGDCWPGAFGRFGLADLSLLAIATLCAAVVVAGARPNARAAWEDPAAAPAVRAAESWRAWLEDIGAGLTLAGVTGTLLEATGAWATLALHPNPAAEQGAPVIVPWLIVVLCVAVAIGTRRMPGPGRRRSPGVRRLAGWFVASLVAWTAAVAVHAARPDPVQGRYYGLPGFVVGRSQDYEYGTYLGMLAPALAALCFIVLLALARRQAAPAGRLS